MNKIINAVKKAVAPKKVVAKEVKEEISTVCSNCYDSGKECNVCFAGKDML